LEDGFHDKHAFESDPDTKHPIHVVAEVTTPEDCEAKATSLLAAAITSDQMLEAQEEVDKCVNNMRSEVNKDSQDTADALGEDDAEAAPEKPAANVTKAALAADKPAANVTKAALAADKPKANTTQPTLVEDKPVVNATKATLVEEKPKANATTAVAQEKPKANTTQPAFSQEKPKVNTTQAAAQDKPKANTTT
jgi:hypothetical protein